jgi:hypothetical protein
MVQKTLTVFECDVCGADGVRYLMVYPDGQMVMDRCVRHNSKQERLREEKGEWVQKGPGTKTGFKVSSLEEIERQRKSE